MPARLLLLVLTLWLAGCGGGDDDPQPRAATPTPTPSGDKRSVGPADQEPEPGAVRVITAWADTLRRGDVPGAATYFALPSTVSNGTAPIRIKTRAEAEFFNRTLPCGAKVVATEPSAHGFVIATFELTERPGAGNCGDGVGGRARTAFLVRDGKITDWLRVPDGAAAEDPELVPA